MSPSLARLFVDRAAAGVGGSLGTPGDELDLGTALGHAAGLAGRLLAGGVEPGERLALVARTSTDYLLTWLACVLAGTQASQVSR